MRSYKAARRAAKLEPVTFEVAYDKPVKHRSPQTGEVTATTYEETVDRFVCRGDIPALLVSELVASADLDAESPEGATLLRQVFASAFGDDEEYQRFFKVATAHLDNDELFDIMKGLMEDFAGRPTTRSSDSSGTPSRTTESGQPSRTDAQPVLATSEPEPEGKVVDLQSRSVTMLPSATSEQIAQASIDLTRVESLG